MAAEQIEIRPGRLINIRFIESEKPTDKTMFLLHGLGGRSAQWLQLADVLSPHANLVIPDFLGHGDSAKPEGAHHYYLTELYQDLLAVYDRYAGEKNYLIGHSFAGLLVMKFLNEFQQKIDAAVLITPTTCQPRAIMWRVYRTFSWLIEIIQMKFISSFTRFAFAKSTSAELIHKEIIASKNNPMYVIQPLVMEILNAPHVDIEHIQTRSLVITAEEDKLTPAKRIRRFYRRLPNATFYHIEQAGHLAILEQPELVNKLIYDFLLGDK